MTDPVAAGSLPDIETCHRLLASMIRIRTMEERCAELYGQMKIRGFLHLYIGEEAVATGILDVAESDDAVMATYREHGHALLKGVSAQAIMAEMFGKVEGCSRGRGGSMHLFDADTRFYGGNAIVAGHLPVAVGLALAEQMAGRSRATICFFGEGAMAEGEFHEAMNLAALWNVPVLFCCENNLYAMGTSLATSESETNLAVKAAAYDMPAWTVDGMDVVAVREAAERALVSIRAGGGPVFLELRTYRFRAHSMFDPDLYRDKDEVERWKERDPITTFSARLRAAGRLDESAEKAIRDAASAEIEQAVAFAEAGTLEPTEELGRFVYRREAGA
ncbi:MAG: pyruvate dehydrogenase (acetyl-transferring) E1 component subunit alpha [Actinomycetia bacterium]|nr:pyruvate dehydrogenase (acetyl-transferring) E1 component subunit alpha [Actinomycetes bacterium]